MNWSTIENRWNDYKGDVQQQWKKLTQDQIDATMGKREHLSARLQEAYGVSEQDAQRQISDWQGKQMDKPEAGAQSGAAKS